MGVADSSFPLKRYPGKMKDTLGYYSRDGKMYYNNKDKGNTTGERYGKGMLESINNSSQSIWIMWIINELSLVSEHDISSVIIAMCKYE